MALGTNISMPPNGVHGRVIVIDGRNGLRAVALTAGNSCSHGVEIPCLLGMTLDTGISIIELEPPVGVRQAGTNTYPGSRGAEREKRC